MKLASRVAVAISVVFTLVLGVFAVIFSMEELDFVEQEMDLHGRLLGRVVASAALETFREQGEAAAKELIKNIDQTEQRIGIRWIEIDRVDGHHNGGALAGEIEEKLEQGQVVGRISPADKDMLYTYVPLSSNAGPMHVIQVAESLEGTNEHVSSLLLRLLGGTALGLLLSGVVAHRLGRRLVGAPVAELVAAARRVGEGDLSHRADETRNDELGVLARELNEMTRSLARARDVAREQEATQRRMELELQHADRLTTLGYLAAGVAHEVGTPLQSIAIRAELIAHKAHQVDGVVDDVQAIKHQVARTTKIVKGLLRFGRKQSTPRSLCDLRENVSSAVVLLESAGRRASVEIRQRPAADPQLADINQEQVEQVLTNLLLNAIQAMPQGGTIEVGVQRANNVRPPADVERRAAQYLCVTVDDEGEGISEDALPYLFDPFFTTKGVDEGTGLGLSVAYGIVRKHDGWIEVTTSPGKGSRFAVFLPAQGSATKADAEQRQTEVDANHVPQSGDKWGDEAAPKVARR